MKALHITITHPGAEPLAYDGLFATTCDAITDAIDRGAEAFGESACIGINVREVRP